MKALFYLIFLTTFVTISACYQPIPKEEDSILEHTTEKIIHDILPGDVEILTIENCEYIVYKEAQGANRAYGYMAHKGNCKNPIHCYCKGDSISGHHP